MEYLITKHAVLNFQFTNYFYGSVKIIGAGTNGENWGFTCFQFHSTAADMQRSNTSKQNTASTSLTHQFTHHWLPGLVSFNTKGTAITSASCTPSS